MEEKLAKLEELAGTLTEALSQAATIIAAQQALLQAVLTNLRDRDDTASDDIREHALAFADRLIARKEEVTATIERIMNDDPASLDVLTKQFLN